MKLISIEIHGLTVEQTIFVALWSWSRATTFQHCDFFMYWQGLRPILTCSTYLWRICGGAIWAHCPSYRPIDSFGDLPCQPFRLLIWTHSWSFYRLKPFFIWILLTNLRNTRRPWRWVLRNSQTFGNCTGTFAWFQRSSQCPCLVHIFGIWESFYHRYQQPWWPPPDPGRVDTSTILKSLSMLGWDTSGDATCMVPVCSKASGSHWFRRPDFSHAWKFITLQGSVGAFPRQCLDWFYSRLSNLPPSGYLFRVVDALPSCTAPCKHDCPKWKSICRSFHSHKSRASCWLNPICLWRYRNWFLPMSFTWKCFVTNVSRNFFLYIKSREIQRLQGWI